MKNKFFSWRTLCAAIVLILAMLACGLGSDTPEPVVPAPQPTAVIVPTASPASVLPSNAGLDGIYSLRGTDMNGNSYGGDLTIQVNNSAAQVADVVYDLSWDNGAAGTGILINDILAASYGGASCGAVFYVADDAMMLTGIWITLDTKAMGSEIASPLAASSSFGGDYSILGTNADGSGYDGALSIIKQGKVWQLVWNVGSDTYDGIGITNGNVLAAAYGGEGCGVALYSIQPNGDLDGVWGMWGNNNLGAEYATRSATRVP
jgi:hypothetical protein